MLTCISCPKQFGRGRAPFDDAVNEISPQVDNCLIQNQLLDFFVASIAQIGVFFVLFCFVLVYESFVQIKDVTSGATEHGQRRHHQGSSFIESVAVATPRTAAAKWRELEARMRSLSSGERTPSVSGRTEASSAFLEDGEDEEPKEWVAQVEPGILITFLSLPQGGNYVRKIRFSQDMFDHYQAQRWWEENYDDVMELYNVQRFNHQAIPLPTPPRSEDEVKKGCALGFSSFDSLEQHKSCRSHYNSHQHSHCHNSGILTTTPKLSSITGSKTETSSTDASTRASYSPKELDQSEEILASVSNASDMEREWVEEDVPGVYITIHELPGGIRELCRVRFSREKFGEMHARLWWEENRTRIRQQYL